MVLRLDPALPFEELKEAVAEKFRESADFFKDAKVALAFDGRELTEEQEMELLQVIDENTRLKVYCIVDREHLEKRKEDRQDEEELKNIGQFFRGTLRFGQVLESETGIVIIGDVEPGAQVIAREQRGCHRPSERNGIRAEPGAGEKPSWRLSTWNRS